MDKKERLVKAIDELEFSKIDILGRDFLFSFDIITENLDGPDLDDIGLAIGHGIYTILHICSVSVLSALIYNSYKRSINILYPKSNKYKYNPVNIDQSFFESFLFLGPFLKEENGSVYTTIRSTNIRILSKIHIVSFIYQEKSNPHPSGNILTQYEFFYDNVLRKGSFSYGNYSNLENMHFMELINLVKHRLSKRDNYPDLSSALFFWKPEDKKRFTILPILAREFEKSWGLFYFIRYGSLGFKDNFIEIIRDNSELRDMVSKVIKTTEYIDCIKKIAQYITKRDLL